MQLMEERRHGARRHDPPCAGVVRGRQEQAEAVALARDAERPSVLDLRDTPSVGDLVDLRSRFDDSWSAGFEIADVVAGGYSVRRVHDGVLLPSPTGAADVRTPLVGTPGW
jgi:hypothetical protein